MELPHGFWEMAERFVDYIHAQTGHCTIVCDDQGIIRTAYVRERIGNPHAGSQKILATHINEIAITHEEELRNPLTKEGLNCAIAIEGVKVGTFGITGKLEIVTSVARLAAMVMSGWVKQLRQHDLLQAIACRASEEIGGLTTQIEAAIGGFESAGRATNTSAHEAATCVANADKVLASVQKIAFQTYLLSMNARIETGRLGNAGRAFAVVADEMGNLSQEAQRSTEAIQKLLEDIRTAIAHVEQASTQSNKIFGENVNAMRSVTPVVQNLVGSIQSLESAFRENVH